MGLMNRCPQCGSKKVKRVVGCMDSLMAISKIFMIISIIGIPLVLIMPKEKVVMRCKKCGARWTV